MPKFFDRPTIFLPVESTPRELDYKLNLARHFCKAGFDVMIGNPPFIRDELKYKNYRGVFLEKGINPDPEYYSSLVEKGILTYDLGDEGAATPVYSINFPPAIEALYCMKRIFLWGQKQREELILINSDSKIRNKYKIVGHPALDLCLPEYKDMYRKLKPRSLPNSYILINTNFGSYNGHPLEEHIKACPNMSDLTYKMVVESYKREAQIWPIFKAWLEEIIEAFPEENFLIRPHPTELAKNYEKAFSKYSNVIVSKEGNANQVIASAKIVLHKDCTTALQSYLMGVPVLSLGGSQLHHLYEQWPLAFGLSPQSPAEANKIIAKLLQDEKWDENTQSKVEAQAQKILVAYFCNVGNSTKELVKVIVQDAKDFLQHPRPYKLIDERTLVQRLKLYIRKLVPLHYKIPIAARETMVKFNKEDISKRLHLLDSVESLGIKYKIKKLYPNAFLISAEKTRI